MKRAIFILLLALCVVSRHEAHAQRALPKMRSIELRSGMVDGFCTAASKDAGYYFGIAMSRYAKHADKWVFGVEYLSRYYPYKAGRIPMAQFTAEGGYYYKFFADPSHTFLFYVGGSAMTGYGSTTVRRYATATGFSTAGPLRWKWRPISRTESSSRCRGVNAVCGVRRRGISTRSTASE